MANPEQRSRFLGWYENFNKVTLVGFLGVAAVAAVTPGLQPLVQPALTLAALDAGQMVLVHELNKKPQGRAA